MDLMNWKTLLEPTELEPTRAARAYIRKGQEILLEAHRDGAGGNEIVSAYTCMMDHRTENEYQSWPS